MIEDSVHYGNLRAEHFASKRAERRAHIVHRPMFHWHKHGSPQAVAPAVAGYQPTDAQIAWHLARFIEQVRGISADPVIVRENWLKAYEFVTDKGALALGDYAKVYDPFAKVGKVQIAVEVASVIRASDDSFRVEWVEKNFEEGQLAGTSRWSAIKVAHDKNNMRRLLKLANLVPTLFFKLRRGLLWHEKLVSIH